MLKFQGASHSIDVLRIPPLSPFPIPLFLHFPLYLCLMEAKEDWSKAIQPLLKKYRNKKHPLEYENIYQLVVMVMLAAQTTDVLVNHLAPELFKKYPDFKSLAKSDHGLLMKDISKVRNFGNKARWMIEIAKRVKDEKNLPKTMEELVLLPGIGRKSANVIMREAKLPAEGVVVDLHVVRVANRIGIADSEDPKKIEQQIMNVLPQKDWAEVGMAISFLGRDICRPSHPAHVECPMQSECKFYLSGDGEKMMKKTENKKAIRKAGRKKKTE